ncbi:hypothetical protein DPEC_G00095720 [Dallia pectoralis]|uniref:Uncharacterized protein n=1 Tax=Dallia pectoralis TaxID=75939 RepID=A0ACC2GV90_DALPE|nr:hypothetical protein DPEC_G00095720 [Dallia pectoralis]
MRILDVDDGISEEKTGSEQKYSVYFQWKRPPRVAALYLGFYVLLLVVTRGLSERLNVALNGVAALSSRFKGVEASKAIDGDRTSHYCSGSCTSTLKETNPWWRVDLREVYRVSTVSLTNRQDCCSERLDGAEIRIGNSLENNGLNNPR